MFLATTALESFWDKSQKILFLGEWCKLYHRRHVWSALPHNTLPYHWLDRDKFRADYRYLDDVYETALRKLADALNELHGTDHSLRYWRIVAGWWLKNFVDILFDRYESLKQAQKQGRVTGTWTLRNEDRYLFVPRNFKEFDRFIVSDAYALQLFSRILESTRLFPFAAQAHDFSDFLSGDSTRVEVRSRGIKRNALDILTAGQRLAPQWMKEITFIESYFNPSALARLQVSLGQYPTLDKAPQGLHQPTAAPDHQLRDGLMLQGDDQFGTLLGQLVGEHLPIVFLEGFNATLEQACSSFPKQPKAIFTSVSHLWSDAFKIWAAESVERGSKLLISQHGGHRGTGQHNSALDHEIAISDTFYSWGWLPENGSSNVRRAPGTKLCNPMIAFGKRPGGASVYLNLSSYPRYSINTYTAPCSALWDSALDFQIKFVKALVIEARRSLRCRAYMVDYGWGEAQRFHDAIPEIAFAPQGKSWQQCMADACLVIETNNQTTLLETLAADIPTVLVLQPEFWEMRSDAQPCFEQLKQAEIYFEDAEAAAQHVNRIYLDPLSWWRQPKVRKAKYEFCDRYAFSSRDWLNLWKAELQSVRSAHKTLKTAA